MKRTRSALVAFLLGMALPPAPTASARRPAANVTRPALKRYSPLWKRRFQRRLPRRARRTTPPPAIVNMVNLHTGDILPIVGHRAPAMRLVDRFLRCRWTGRVTRMDPRLARWVLQAARHFGASEVQIISGFRHEKFNDMLRKKGRGAARKSNHRLGRAVDFRLVGVETQALARYLRRRRLGGVGRYPVSKFVHLDVGRVRTWGGN